MASPSFDSYLSEPIPDAQGGTGPTDSSIFQNIESQSDPVHTYDYTPLQNLDADRNELVKQWLSARDYEGPEKVQEFQGRAKQLGMTLDDLLAKGEENKSLGDKWATKLYRNGGPIFRGAMNSADSTQTFITNLAYRGLSNVPGWENLSTEADKNNRALQAREAIGDILNREGSVADITGPGGAAFLGNVSQGLADVATVAATGGGSAEASVAGATAEEMAAASKVAQLAAAKKAAVYFGLKKSEQELTVATDHGMSPNMRLLHAGVMGGTTAAFTYGFGQWAETLGYSTTEQAVIAGKPAVERLMQRSGLADAAGGMAISAGEQATMEASQMMWGSFAGTDTTDDAFNRIAKSAATGAAMRGTAEVLPAVKSFHDAYIRTQEAMPDTVKGTLDAQKAAAAGETPVVPENASQAYKDAVQSELDAIADMHAEAQKSLAGVKLGEESLKSRMDKLLSLRQEHSDISSELSALGDGEHPDAAALSGQLSTMNEGMQVEADAIRAQRDALVTRRKTAESDIKAAEELFNGLDDNGKTEIQSKVIGDLETSRIKNEIDSSKDSLTRAQNSENAAFRAQEGYSQLAESDRVSMEQSLQNARDKGLITRADDIAKDVLNTKRGISADEQAGLVEAGLQRNAAIVKYSKMLDDANISAADKADATVNLQEARKSADIISRSLNEGASDPARMLAQRRYEQDNKNPANVREYGRKVKGSDLTIAEADGLTADAVKLSDTEMLARKAMDAKLPADAKLLTEPGFVFREILRAEQSKGSPLSETEQADVTSRAKKLFANSGDVATLDAALQQKLADDLYVKGVEQRAALDRKILSLEPRTFTKQISSYASFSAGLMRGWLTGGDLFPLFRQGILHPFQAFKAFPNFFKALRSSRETILAQREVMEHPYYKASQEAGLAIMDADAPFILREGSMMDAAHESLPFIGNFARAFRVGMNTFRMGVFESQINANGGLAKWNSGNLKALGEFTNCATGRGTLPGFEQSASTLAHLMIGPRFFWSRLQYFTGVPMLKAAYGGNKLATQVMLKTYAKQIAGLAVMTGVAEVMGKAAFGPDAVEFHRDPRDFDFGRLRIGNTMIDVTGGLARPYRYATALLEPIIAKAQDRPSLRKTGNTVLGIARGQLAPVPSALVSAGEVYTGKKQAGAEALNYIVPWSWKDSVQALQNEGMEKGAAIAALNMFGAGSYTTEKQ